jgi:hypothetical protein
VCDNTTLNVGSQCPTLNVVFFFAVYKHILLVKGEI